MAFDPYEFGLDDSGNPLGSPVGPAVVNHNTQVAVAPPQYARRMSEIEQKLLKAQYYRALMDSSFFDTEDQISQQVEAEIKEFVVKRMEALVNGSVMPQPSVSQFTEAEVQSLKLWVVKMQAMANRPAAPQPAPVIAPTPAPQPVIKAKVGRKAKNPTVPEKAPAAPVEPPKPRGRPPQQRPPGYTPVPQGTAFTAASQMAAQQQVLEEGSNAALANHIISKG